MLKRTKLPHGYKYLIVGRTKYIISDFSVLEAIEAAFHYASYYGLQPHQLSSKIYREYGVTFSNKIWRDILSNEFYTGYIEGVQHIYKPIVTQDNFKKTQEALAKEGFLKKTCAKSISKYKYVGIFSCEECNSTCSAYTAKRAFIYYQCNKNYRNHSSKCFNELHIDAALRPIIQHLKTDDNFEINNYLKSTISHATLGPSGIHYTLFIDKNSLPKTEEMHLENIDPFLEVLSIARTVEELCTLWNMSLIEVQSKLLDFSLEDKVIETESGTWKRI